MKPKTPSAIPRVLPTETPAERAARRRRLKRLLNAGLGLKPAELSKAVRRDYLETFRSGGLILSA